jgi:hypothetical protein
MSRKTVYYIASFIGSLIGGYIPALWGGGLFSMSSLFFGGIGAIAGIIIAYKLSD